MIIRTLESQDDGQSRIEAKNVAAWTQPLYMSDFWRELAMRADMGNDPDVHQDIAAVMRRYQDHAPACTDDMIEGFEASHE